MTDARVDRVREWLLGHQPRSGREARSRAQTLGYLAWLPRPFDEAADPVHLTASAIVLDGAGRTLLHRHKRLGLWLQPGGHVDGDERPEDAVLREVREETGLDGRHPADGGAPVHVDVHEGGRGHLHLDLRYVVLAPPRDPAPPDGESQDVRWLTYEQARRLSDGSFADALDAVLRDERPGHGPVSSAAFLEAGAEVGDLVVAADDDEGVAGLEA